MEVGEAVGLSECKCWLADQADVRKPHSTRDDRSRQIGVTKKLLFFSVRGVSFRPKSCKHGDDPTLGQLQRVANVSSNCGRFLQVQRGVPKFGLRG